jgi:sugar lactone lactonase YvrE
VEELERKVLIVTDRTLVTGNEEVYADHDGGAMSPVDFRVVATWPAGSFAENLAIDSAGEVFVSLYSHSRVDRYDPASGITAPFAHLPAPVMGLAFDAQGSLWATGGPFRKGPGYIWKIAADGSVRHWADLPDALFMNGCTLHPDGRTLLACESLTGRILAIDLRHPNRCAAWLTDDRLKPAHPTFPGANGIKIRDGWAWISVSGRRLILRAPVQADGSPGPIETAATRVVADDFAFGVSGSLYIATHPEQTVVRLDPSGARVTVAGPDQGAVGSTACAFGCGRADANALYVTTNGGLTAPYQGVVQEAKLLRLEVGEAGWPLMAKAGD